MKLEYVKDFIDTYHKYYYSGYTITDEVVEKYGIPKNLNQTDEKLEKYIISKLEKGIYDEETFAWKAGRAKWKNDAFDYNPPLPNEWVNGNGGKIKISREGDVFNKDDFVTYLKNNKISVDNNEFDKEDVRKQLFISIKEKYHLYNYGTVNIINQMFFLSKGAIPLYDYYAHLGVKALFMKKSPLEIYISDAPSKDAHPKGKNKQKNDFYMAVNLLEEYIWLLKEVFPKEIHKDGNIMYISRELDQALWVYGHATEKYKVSQ